MVNQELRNKLLKVIGYTEPTDFSELCTGLGSFRPCSSPEWAKLFQAVDDMEEEGLVETDKSGRNLESIQLTEEGAALARDLKKR